MVNFEHVIVGGITSEMMLIDDFVDLAKLLFLKTIYINYSKKVMTASCLLGSSGSNGYCITKD